MHRLIPSFARAFAAGLLALASLPAIAAPDRGAAERALLDGRLDEAVALLRPLIAANPHDAPAHLLLCRALYAEDKLDLAVTACEAAINNGGAADSRTQDWMGRAYGRKADQSSKLTAFTLARRVKAAFERAVQLDPANPAAVNDLSEYYVNAPAIVGGGVDKAEALATRVSATLPSSTHRIRAMIAEKQGDFAHAEQEFRAAAESGNKPGGFTDLGDFYARRKQPDKAVAALRKAVEADTAHGPSLLDVASILNGMHREPALAQNALRLYLASTAKSDASPACKAHSLLAQMLAAAGDKPAARSEFNAALGLSSEYAPARKGLQGL